MTRIEEFTEEGRWEIQNLMDVLNVSADEAITIYTESLNLPDDDGFMNALQETLGNDAQEINPNELVTSGAVGVVLDNDSGDIKVVTI